MAYNKDIENRIAGLLQGSKNTDSKKMFGGICFLLNNHIFCGIYKDDLILRLGEDQAKVLLGQDYIKPFDITGKPMKGWIMVPQEAFKSDSDLMAFLDKARDFAQTLPPK